MVFMFPLSDQDQCLFIGRKISIYLFGIVIGRTSMSMVTTIMKSCGSSAILENVWLQRGKKTRHFSRMFFRRCLPLLLSGLFRYWESASSIFLNHLAFKH